MLAGDDIFAALAKVVRITRTGDNIIAPIFADAAVFAKTWPTLLAKVVFSTLVAIFAFPTFGTGITVFALPTEVTVHTSAIAIFAIVAGAVLAGALFTIRPELA